MPVRQIELPAISGRVVDDQGRPVPDASVLVEGARDHSPIASIRTDAGGRFSQDEQWSTGLWIFPGGDRIAVSYDITANKKGRRSATTQVSGGSRVFQWGPRPAEQLGDLELK